MTPGLGTRLPGRGWSRWGGVMGAALLLAVLPLAGGAQQVMGRGAPADTVQTDSTRIRVMEALERISRPPVARQLIVDGDSAFLAGVAAAVEARRRSPAARGPASMTDGADSVMAALLELPGYDPARYEGEYAEFEAGEGRLTLLSSAGLALRRPGGVPDSIFPGDSLSGADPAATPVPAAPVSDTVAVAPDSITGLPDSAAVVPDSAAVVPDTAAAATPPDTVVVAETVVIVPDSVALPDSGAVSVPVPEMLQEEDTVAAEEAIVPTRLFFEGREIQADTAIRYFERSGRINTVGRTITVDASGEPLESRNLIYSVEEERGTALGARTRYDEGGGEWFVYGDANSIRPGEAWLHDAIFTSCDLETPHSHFNVDEIKIINGRVLVARPVVLYFADVPVAWLPFIAQGLGTGRTSGLLTPRFSVNDIVRASSGYSRRVSNVGFYWAMSEYTDASIAMDWFSGNFTALTGTLQYRWARRFLDGNIAYRQYWREEGRRELAFDTRHRWQLDERTNFALSARYSSSSDFVRQNSFDPREAVQSINSEGGFSRRFDWGNLSLSANRQQYLSDDRVEMTLPSLNLSLNPVTFLQAPPGRERFYNNVTWNGSGSYRRSTLERPLGPDEVFNPNQWDRTTTTGQVSSSFSVGGFSWSQNADFDQRILQGAPVFGEILDPVVDSLPPILGLADQGQAEVSWSSALSYQQRLIGSTTLTPSVSFSGRLIQADSLAAVSNGYIEAPRRISFGMGLGTDIYGFFPGFGGFDAFRHKISPRVTYSYQPAVIPTELQQQVFGAFEARARNQVQISLNQTIEARRPPREEAEPAPGAPPADSLVAGVPADSLGADSLQTGPMAQGSALPTDPNAPTRRPQAETVKILGLSTSAITYDFVVADSLGVRRAISPTILSNTVQSDFLRGLSLNFSTEIFDDSALRDDGPRRFDPFLTSVSTSFALGSSSAIFRWLGLFQGGGDDQQPVQEPQVNEGGLGDESAIVPGLGSRPGGMSGSRFTGTPGAWNANFSYALQRSRLDDRQNQLLQANLSFRPTANWDVSWQTSYDLANGGFNDHLISLTRDLHEWRATFDFVQTVTGNWSFRFNVALVANPDLKFDYEQRSQIPDVDGFRR